MEKTKKMILVDPDHIQRLQQQTHSRPLETTLSSLDDEMGRILNKRHVSDNDKWQEYNQVLQRYLHFVGESRKPIEITFRDSQVLDTTDPVHAQEGVDNSLKNDTLESLPKTVRHKARLIFDKLSSSKDINWGNVGSVTIKGKNIPGSSITDLIADAVRNRRSTNPEGWLEFADILTALNIPQELIGNTRRKDFIRQKHHYTATTPLSTGSPTSRVVKRKRLVENLRPWEEFSF